MSNSVFTLEPLQFSNGTEEIVRGGRKLFPLLPQAFTGVKQIAFIGWGSQAPAQAQNLRDSLKSIGSDIIVKVGLQTNSKSVPAAREAGFTEEQGTLGHINDIVPEADIVIFLISDGAQTELWQWVTGLMKPWSTLGLSHGFLLGYLKSVGKKFRPDINVIMMAPKGMGKSVRLLYLQGSETEGAGINSSVAVEQDVTGHALNYAIAWAVGTGSPVTFFTTMWREFVSDIYGERSMLLGGLYGASEALYRYHLFSGSCPEQGFLDSAKGLTSTVSEIISTLGLAGCAEEMELAGHGGSFDSGYSAAYPIMHDVMTLIYKSVSDLDEIRVVIEATAALRHTPMPSVEKSDMWKVAREADLYKAHPKLTSNLAFAAGVYVAGIMSQMSILREHGHCTSEVVNESLIEAIDSLNPFMDVRGLSYMIDNCSTTARLGARKWGPTFAGKLYARFTSHGSTDWSSVDKFFTDPIHKDILRCFELRPPVKIAVS